MIGKNISLQMKIVYISGHPSMSRFWKKKLREDTIYCINYTTAILQRNIYVHNRFCMFVCVFLCTCI